MKRVVNIDTWNRKEQFQLFMGCSDPVYGITANVECQEAIRFCKSEKVSFFLYYLHASLKAVNSVENLKMRFEDENVVVFDTVHGSSTIGREDGTFGFSIFEYRENFGEFLGDAEAEVRRVKEAKGLSIDLSETRMDMVHYSSIPWVSFTSIIPERHSGPATSIPKIFFGKYFEESSKVKMPVSFHAHHALSDGLHAGMFFKNLEENLSACKF